MRIFNLVVLGALLLSFSACTPSTSAGRNYSRGSGSDGHNHSHNNDDDSDDSFGRRRSPGGHSH